MKCMQVNISKMDPMGLYQQHVWAILVSREVVFGHQEVANRRDNSTQIDLICRLVLNLNMDPLTLNVRIIVFRFHVKFWSPHL